MKLKFSTHTIVTLCLSGSLLLQPAWAVINPKPASEFTIQANQNVLHTLPFNDKQDFEDARRGFIAKPDTLTIKDEKGNVVWDLEQYKTYIGLDKTAPDTVNPSLWRNAQLNMEYGLFKVTDKIYQIRGFDLSNITFIQGDKGWIVFDPLISPQTAKAALAFINKTLGERPVSAVVYSHSHVDHYGGAAGLFNSPDEVKKNGVQIIAPEGFTEHAVSENVIAGNAMARRAVYMYGALLPRNAQGSVNGGLGQTTSTGVPSLLLPTRFITKTGEEVTLDGVRMVFQMTPGTEAPAEMNTWFPDSKALWMAENTTNTMHNILTLRGAQVRDALKWSSYLNETIETWGDQAQVKFQSHHWPRWGNASIVDYFKKQRDLYKYIHDQSVRLMNMGYTGEEISEKIALPPELNDFWPNRGYYGTLRHNSRAVYQRYMGWYSGNPSDLDNLPPEMVGPKYVEFMGGEQALLKKAKASFDKGEYRWVAEVLKHLVFANPNNQEGKLLLADALEQLGYQAESGPWRSVYLQGAYELRNGVPTAGGTVTASPDTIRAMSPSMLFDYLAVRINPEKAAGKKMVVNMDFTDIGEKHTLSLENAVLNHTTRYAASPDVTVTLSKQTLDDIQLGQGTLEQKIASGEIKVQGDQQTFSDFVGLLDKFNFWFNIVTP
ncbi:MBL fold metallo-hydrolase [Aeromonas enteropelogenes]|uniref:alkyl/aryl-sulfatase n=1 Tax=Aeromonas enteropelogenes TaxID=29489 RepID=UPI0005A93A6A|nr:alkyl sulfatase dimerization domain-containing protein [Aeromonas enteropelogenes]UBH56347.1 MBL fold metallo-hydrolase [Aeromonas enteropelogenes]UCA09217.1 MBL fold metallo-hydrolase [Aeromonas enteropelogenes]